MPDDENRTANDTDCVNLLVIGDIHLRATGERFPVEKLPVADHDVVVSLGDIIDENRDHAKSAEAGDTYEQRGREFFEHLDKQGVPILAVPGNHDPLTCTQRLVDGLENIEIIHRDAVAIPTDTTEKNVTVVGWGCERFDFTPALLTPDYPDVPLNASQPPTPDVVAETVQRTAGRYLTGLDSQSVLAEQLEISDGDQSRFAESLARLEDRFETLVDLIQDAPNLHCSG